MSKTLTFELPDEIFEVLQQQAAQSGRSTEAVALEWLARHASKPQLNLTAEELAAAWEGLRRFAGAADSGDPHAADNERIDADLAAENGSTREKLG